MKKQENKTQKDDMADIETVDDLIDFVRNNNIDLESADDLKDFVEKNRPYLEEVGENFINQIGQEADKLAGAVDEGEGQKVQPISESSIDESDQKQAINDFLDSKKSKLNNAVKSGLETVRKIKDKVSNIFAPINDELDLKRNLAHVGPILGALSLSKSGAVSWSALRNLAGTAGGVASLIESARLNGYAEPFNQLLRDYEKDTVGGYAYALFGIAAAMIAGDEDEASIALQNLGVGDTAARIFSEPTEDVFKNWEGMVAMFASSFAITKQSFDGKTAFVVAIACTLADGVKLQATSHHDDNLTIPILTVLAIKGVKYFED